MDVPMIRRLLSRRPATTARRHRPDGGPLPARALLVLPYLSIVSEKTAHLTELLKPAKAGRVQGYGGVSETGTPLTSPVSDLAALIAVHSPPRVPIHAILYLVILSRNTCE